MAETSLAVLEFFAPVLRSGEYIVIDDSAVRDSSPRTRSSPSTRNPNGYLRRL
jgi:cephalosporin hydroxylase